MPEFRSNKSCCIVEMKDGSTYEGTWNETGKGIKGKGVMCSPNGKKEAGKWRKGIWRKRFLYQNFLFEVVSPIRRHPVSALIALGVLAAFFALGCCVKAEDIFDDPYLLCLLGNDPLTSTKCHDFPAACMIFGAALCVTTLCGLLFKQLNGIHWNPLTAMIMFAMALGGVAKAFAHSGTLIYFESGFVLLMLTSLCKFYYKSARVEWIVPIGFAVLWLSAPFFRNSYYFFDGMRWPFALPLFAMIFCLAWGRLKYEQHGIFPAHRSLSMALIGMAITFVLGHDVLNITATAAKLLDTLSLNH